MKKDTEILKLFLITTTLICGLILIVFLVIIPRIPKYEYNIKFVDINESNYYDTETLDITDYLCYGNAKLVNLYDTNNWLVYPIDYGYIGDNGLWNLKTGECIIKYRTRVN